MSHINIVEISTERIPLCNCHREINGLYDDSVFLDSCDWGGKPVDNYDKELKQIQADLSEVATVNIRRRTIRFRSKKAVLRAYRRNIAEAYREHLKAIREGHINNYALEKRIKRPCGIDYLYYNDYCLNGGDLIESYVNGYLPQTLYIGTICDAHY